MSMRCRLKWLPGARRDSNPHPPITAHRVEAGAGTSACPCRRCHPIYRVIFTWLLSLAFITLDRFAAREVALPNAAGRSRTPMFPVTVSTGSKPERIRRHTMVDKDEGTRTRTSIHWVRASSINHYADAPSYSGSAEARTLTGCLKDTCAAGYATDPGNALLCLRGLRFILSPFSFQHALDWRPGIRTRNLPLIRRVL